MNLLNEHFQALNEDMKFEALSQLREIQSNLVTISFLPVIAIMKQENPLKKDVLKFQDDLDELTMQIQSFISTAKNDVSFEPEAEEGGEEAPAEDEKEEEPVDDKEEKEDEPEDEEKDKKKKPEDSSEPKE